MPYREVGVGEPCIGVSGGSVVLPGPPSMNIRGYGFVWNLQGIGKAKGCWKTVEGARRGGKVNAQPRAGVGVLGAQGWVLQGMRSWERVLWLELWETQ